MQSRSYLSRLALIVFGLCSLAATGFGQAGGTLRGTVTLADGGGAVHNVRVTIIQLKRSTETDEKGNYEFKDVLLGKYDVTAHLDLAPNVIKTVQVTGGAATADFEIHLLAVRESVTVTATGSEETTFNTSK